MTGTAAQIADHYRRAILTGDMPPGERLPSNRALADRHGVAVATIGRALSQLQVEGAIRTSPRGTFVADEPRAGISGQDRFLRVLRSGSFFMAGESAIVTDATIMVPPLYVADLFALEPGEQLVRREFTTGRGSGRLAHIVTWHPAPFAALLPALLKTGHTANADVIGALLEATGRVITEPRDDMHAREASAREASVLGLRVGAPVLGLVWRWQDAEGIIEYGECVLPTRATIGYRYEPVGL